MLGDQLALVWIVRSHPSFEAKRFTKPQAFTQEIAGASVLFLPCALYNWTPPEGAGQFHGMPLDVKVLSQTPKNITNLYIIFSLIDISIKNADCSLQRIKKTTNARGMELPQIYFEHSRYVVSCSR